MRRVLGIVAALAVIVGVVPASAAPTPKSHVSPRVEDDSAYIDVRATDLRAPLASAAAAARELQTQVDDLRVTWNGRSATAKFVFSDSGFLTRPVRASAERIARAWIQRNRALFGLSADAVANMVVTRDATLPRSGLDPLVFRVVYGDIHTFAGGAIGVNVMPDGKILTVWSSAAPSGRLDPQPILSAADALKVAARYERVRVSLEPRGQRRGADRLAIFGRGGLAAPHNVRLVAFPTADGPRLAWRVFLAKSLEAQLMFAVDARDGAVLFRGNQVAHRGETGLVFENYPGAPKGGTEVEVSFDGDPEASPNGWVGIPAREGDSAPVPTTVGNNVFAFADWAYVAGEPTPTSAPLAPNGHFLFPFTNEWSKACEPIEDGVVENPSFMRDRDSSVTNAFFLGNRYHDMIYKLGFTEAMGNFQYSNFGKGGKEADAVRIMAQASILAGGTNNAWFSTPPDGGEPTSFVNIDDPTYVASYSSPMTAEFLNRPVLGYMGSCSDNDQDASTVWHEFTHGTSNRVVGGPDDASALNGQQSGAMGEAWSDWFATAFLWRLGLEDRAVAGGYPDNNYKTGVRNFALDDRTLTYGDFGFSRRGPEVHADGEIWTGALWDIRAALVAKHGKTEGAKRAEDVIFQAMAIAPAFPTFLDMRDAILKADTALHKGQDRALLWHAFAGRGMGASAKTSDASDVHPTPAFDVPGANNVTVSGTITDADGGTLIAKILAGWGNFAENPIVKSKPDGTFSFKIERGRTLQLHAAAQGYGVQLADRIVASRDLHLDIRMFKNLASYGYGAQLTAGLAEGESGLALIDDKEASMQAFATGEPVVVKLARPGLVNAVSITPRGGGEAAVPLEYGLELSSDGKTWKDVFSGKTKFGIPYTTAMAQQRRSVKIEPKMFAGYVRATVTKSRIDDVTGLASLQVFGSAPGLRPRSIASQAPFIENANIAVANQVGDTASVTLAAWQLTCIEPTAPIQGLDSWITEFPDGVGDGAHDLFVKNSGGTATDIDVFFYASDCTTQTGRIATGAADETGPIPSGTRWAQFIVWAGTTDGFEVKAVSSLEPTLGPKTTQVKGRHVTKPVTGLPSTGVETSVGWALLLTSAALVARRRLVKS